LIAIGFVAVIGAMVGAYLLGMQEGSREQVSATAPAAPQRSASVPPATQVAPGPRPQSAPAPHPGAQPGGTAAAADVDPNAQFTHFRVGQRNVKDILPDGDIVWVGTSGGVIRYDTRTDEYKLFDVRSGLLANGVFHLSKLDGRLVVGTYGGGMAIMKEGGDGWDIFNIPEGLADAFVYDVLKADNGDVWIATWSGANRVRGGDLHDASKWDTFTVENTQGGLPNDWVYGMARGKNGEIWLATEGGLARFKDETWQHWNHTDGQGAPYELVRDQIAFDNDPAKFSKHHARQKTEMGLEQVDVAYNPNYIVSLLVDRQGVVWAGTWGGGLARFDGSQWTNYTMADGLPANHVFMLYEDNKGRIWVGTSNGLALRDGDTFKVFTTRDGLFSNNVFSMATAADGTRWIGSFGGVAQIASLP